MANSKRVKAAQAPTAKALAEEGAAQGAPDILHPADVDKVRLRMPSDDTLFDLAELFKVFGDSTRVRILSALSYSELCVGDLAALLGMTQSAISHQLRELRTSKLVRARKQGKVVYYALDDEHVNAIIAIGMQHICED